MGFKCPICLKDFGRDKDRWMEHIKIAHCGAGKDCLDMVQDAVEKKDKGGKDDGENKDGS